MTNDPLEKLIKESQIETSAGFTDLLFEKYQQGLIRKARIRLYMMVLSIVLLFGLSASILIIADFKLMAFGEVIRFSKFGVMIGISGLTFFTILNQINLLQYIHPEK